MSDNPEDHEHHKWEDVKAEAHEHSESDPEAGTDGHGQNTDEEMMFGRLEDEDAFDDQ